MKKVLMIIAFLAVSFAPLAVGQVCIATATDCGATASVVAPSGGSCTASDDDFRALAIAYDANGQVISVSLAMCPIGPC